MRGRRFGSTVERSRHGFCHGYAVKREEGGNWSSCNRSPSSAWSCISS